MFLNYACLCGSAEPVDNKKTSKQELNLSIESLGLFLCPSTKTHFDFE